MNIKNIEQEKSAKIEVELKRALKSVGVLDVNPSWDSTLKCYTAMKIIPNNSDIPSRYMKYVTEKGYRGSVKWFEEGSNICVFKLYEV